MIENDGGDVQDNRLYEARLEEYAFLRQEAMGSIEKQDRCFFVIYAATGIAAYLLKFEEPRTALIASIMTMFLIVVLQAKIIDYRNVLYYTSSYLIFLEENYVPFRWERRFARFFETYSKIYETGRADGIIEDPKQRKRAQNRKKKLIRISKIKHGINSFLVSMIFALVFYLLFLQSPSIEFWIKALITIAALALTVISILLTWFVIKDKSTKQEYCRVWRSIKAREDEDANTQPGKIGAE